jgi:hypothetical protein
MLCLLNTRYWGQVLIIQEILLAQDLVILCGTMQLPWRCFQMLRNGISYLNEPGLAKHPTAAGTKLSAAMRLLNQRSRWTSMPSDSRGFELHHLLEAHLDVECTDKCDRIFGVLSFAITPSGCIHITPDYSMSDKDLYRRVVWYFNDTSTHPSDALQQVAELQHRAVMLQRLLKLDQEGHFVLEVLESIHAWRNNHALSNHPSQGNNKG